MQSAKIRIELDPEAGRLRSITPSDRFTARLFFLFVVLLAGFSLPRMFELGKLTGNSLGTYSLQWVGLLSIMVALALAELVILILLLTNWCSQLGQAAVCIQNWMAGLRYVNLVAFCFPWLSFVLPVLWRFEKQFAAFLPRVWLFWLSVFFGAICLVAYWKKLPLFWSLLATATVYGFGVKALGYLPEITSYPFSLSWSEASRFYYSSLPYAQQLFGMPIPLSALHPSRYLLMGVPYLISASPLWLHRFWQVFLWLAMSLASGLALARRFRMRPWFILLFSMWAALYMLQGPVYYHLHICVILVFLGFDRRKFWQTLVVVGAASVWAGISRVNWFPVPAILAATLYFLEQPFSTDQASSRVYQRWIRYYFPPFIWGMVGTGIALLSQTGYVLISGNEDISAFGSSFTSDLLWYRLLPSPTYKFGVLPTILLVCAPFLIMVGWAWIGGKKNWHFSRILGLCGMAGVLFVGGLVVSTKIGGGSNIHNLDAFIVMLLVVGAYVLLDKYAAETPQRFTGNWIPWWLVLLVIIFPILWNLNIGDPFIKRNNVQGDYDLAKLAQMVEKYSSHGEVLFITQRQMLVFNLVPEVELVPDYELLTLSEMAISNNQPYLDRFYQDLREHRFTLIVADRQSQTLKNPALDPFAEENNAWVKHIARYLMQYYQSEEFFDTQGVDMLVPREGQIYE